MPFLRARNMTQAVSAETRKSGNKSKMAIRSLEDLRVAEAVKAWIHEDDLSTAKELALLGL